MEIHIIKTGWLWEKFIFTMGILILIKCHLYIEIIPRPREVSWYKFVSIQNLGIPKDLASHLPNRIIQWKNTFLFDSGPRNSWQLKVLWQVPHWNNNTGPRCAPIPLTAPQQILPLQGPHPSCSQQSALGRVVVVSGVLTTRPRVRGCISSWAGGHTTRAQPPWTTPGNQQGN